MNCYFCVNGKHPGGTYYDVQQAVGVCQGCGAGVCQEHGKRREDDGGHVLCEDCAARRKRASTRAA